MLLYCLVPDNKECCSSSKVLQLAVWWRSGKAKAQRDGHGLCQKRASSEWDRAILLDIANRNREYGNAHSVTRRAGWLWKGIGGWTPCTRCRGVKYTGLHKMQRQECLQRWKETLSMFGICNVLAICNMLSDSVPFRSNAEWWVSTAAHLSVRLRIERTASSTFTKRLYSIFLEHKD